jgi:L-fuculose-phosphate aldolase
MTEEPGRIKKVFLSDWELKRMNASGRKAGSFPENAIISPLSSEWLEYDRQSQVTGHKSHAGAREPQAAGRGGARTEVALRVRIAEIGRRLYPLGFVPSTDGNISARLDDNSVLITPAGVAKGTLTPEDITKIDLEGRLISGKKPSSEYLLHLCFYKTRPDVMAVIHAHPPLATGLASAGMALDRPLTSEIVITLGKVPLAEYATPGTAEVTDSIAGLVKGHNAIMLANHGVVTCGPDLEIAFQRMETVEQAAKITLVAEHLGGGRLIPPDKVQKLEEMRRRLGF